MDAESRADQTIHAHPEEVAAWLAGRPGAWGFLAGQAVLGERARLGRRLTEPERRRVWAALWAALERRRGEG